MQALLWALFAVASGLFYWQLRVGAQTLPLFTLRYGSWQFKAAILLDFLSSVMLLMVTLLGAIIGRYSQMYLAGERRQAFFYRYLLLTLLSVSAWVLASDLLVFWLMRLLTHVGLHQLLVFFPTRPSAVAAARKKFFVSRLGDLALLAAIVIAYQAFGTLEFAGMAAAASARGAGGVVVVSRGVLELLGCALALAAMTQSAQFPFQFWLPETMEAPTPVSALMHAGIINAGGFFLIRLAGVMRQADLAHFLLTLAGSCTAVFGALVMITQNNIKQKLAYSTISQMGLMIWACGLQAYSLALFHILAHSFYKAHAFLSTGMLVAEAKKAKWREAPFSLGQSVIVVGCGFLLILGVGWRCGGAFLSSATYAAVLLLGLAQNLRFPAAGRGQEPPGLSLAHQVGLALTLGVAALVSGGLECLLFENLLQPPLVEGASDWQVLTLCLLSFTVFAAGFLMSQWLVHDCQAQQQQGQQRVWRERWYLYFWHGGYFLERTRWIEKLWRRAASIRRGVLP